MTDTIIHSRICKAPLQVTCSEALSAQPRQYKLVLIKQLAKSTYIIPLVERTTIENAQC